MADVMKPRWGQPLTGIISSVVFLALALLTWYIFSDPRGPIGWFPYPFLLFLAIMILVGLWQHMFLGDWPFENMKQPMKGVVMTIVNLILTWFVIDVVFYRILGIGLNFFNYYNLAATGAPNVARAAIVGFVLMGFYLYPLGTIFFAKWPIRPSNLTQPAAGLAEIAWSSMFELFGYVILIIPFFGGVALKGAPAMGTPWWASFAGTAHIHWVFGWWEWAIIILFMFPNVWRMKPLTLINIPQPAKGFVYMGLSFVFAYIIMLIMISIIPMWVPAEAIEHMLHAKGQGEVTRFLYLHSAEIAGMTLIPFLTWHHYFDDKCGVDVDSWAGFWIRTVGVMIFAAVLYWIYYYAGFGYWALGNSHMHEFSHRFAGGESLIWNFWWIVPLLWNEWFFHKWPFYVHEHH